MSLANGVITKTLSNQTEVDLAVSNASGGTSPYTYQWYMSTVSGFTPGSGNAIAGATAQTVKVTGLVPGRTYYFSNVVTDSASPTPATDEATQLAVTTDIVTPSPNQFKQSPTVGQLAGGMLGTTDAVKISDSVTALLPPGMAVKLDSASTATSGPPEVVPCTADTDSVWGFLVYNGLNPTFTGGMLATVARKAPDKIYLMPTANGNRGDRMVLDVTAVGGVCSKTGSAGENIVGFAYDKPVAGTPCRVEPHTPSFTYNS